MNTLTRKGKQWWCLHHWVKFLEVDVGFNGFIYEWKCDVCDKVVYKPTVYAPISGIIPDPWLDYKKDPIYNSSPSILKRKD